MGMESGGYFCKCSRVNPANSGRYPCRSASVKVDMVGLNIAAWAKVMSSAGFAVPLAALALALAVGV